MQNRRRIPRSVGLAILTGIMVLPLHARTEAASATSSVASDADVLGAERLFSAWLT